MWLAIALVVAISGALLTPFANRLHATGLWLGKALVDPMMAQAMPNGLQDAITAGWPSSLVLALNLFRLSAVFFAFIHKWWMAPVVFILGSFVAGKASLTAIAPVAVERYVFIFVRHARRRSANFNKAGDTERAALAESLAKDLENLLVRYANQGVPAPDFALAQQAPFGDSEYLLKLWVASRNTVRQ